MLAYDVATGLLPVHDIAHRHGISVKKLNQLCETEGFRKQVAQMRAEWESLENTSERIKHKARLAIEEGIVSLYELLTDTKVNAAARVAAAKELKDISDLGLKQEHSPMAGLPSISIVIGEQRMDVNAVDNKAAQEEKNEREVFDLRDYTAVEGGD